MSQHEIAIATKTNHIEGFIGKSSICKSPLIILLSSLLLRLGWSTVSYCGCFIQMTGGEQKNDTSLRKCGNLNQNLKSEGKI